MIHRKKSVSDRNTQADGSIEKESERNKKGREREKRKRGERKREATVVSVHRFGVLPKERTLISRDTERAYV